MARKNAPLSARERKAIEIIRENNRRRDLAQDFNIALAKVRELIDDEKGNVYYHGKDWPEIYPSLRDPEED
jgi:hypothetical protein